MPTDGDCTAEGRTGEDAHGARHPKKSGGVFCEGAAVRYAFIERHEQVWPITTQCRVLAVSASGYHQHWALSEAPDQPGRIRDMALLVHIRAVFTEMKGGYGWLRIWRELVGYGSGGVVCSSLSPVVGIMPLSGRNSTYHWCSVFPSHLSF